MSPCDVDRRTDEHTPTIPRNLTSTPTIHSLPLTSVVHSLQHISNCFPSIHPSVRQCRVYCVQQLHYLGETYLSRYISSSPSFTKVSEGGDYALLLQSILHGSPEAKRAGDVELQQHSRLVARGKYVHAFECMSTSTLGLSAISHIHVLLSRVRRFLGAVHRVKPESAEQYKAAAYALLPIDIDITSVAHSTLVERSTIAQ